MTVGSGVMGGGLRGNRLTGVACGPELTAKRDVLGSGLVENLLGLSVGLPNPNPKVFPHSFLGTQSFYATTRAGNMLIYCLKPITVQYSTHPL